MYLCTSNSERLNVTVIERHRHSESVYSKWSLMHMSVLRTDLMSLNTLPFVILGQKSKRSMISVWKVQHFSQVPKSRPHVLKTVR